LSTASNLVFQTTPNGLLKVFTADKGEKLFEVPSGQTGGIGPPMTYLLDGKQYIAFMGGQGAVAGGRGRGAPPVAPAEPAAAAAPQPPPVPAAPINPKLYVYAVDSK
jgi:quinohemoprotein ethanol dehydrogenase